MSKESLITDEKTLKGAKSRFGHDIPVYDDGYGPLWIHRNSLGISGIVRAQTWGDAYEICEDEFFPSCNLTYDELVKEYGEYWSENELFQEAYGFRPNGRKEANGELSHIYAKDLNRDYLERLTAELLAELEITLTIEDPEHPEA